MSERMVTREAQKAETWLKNHEKRKAESISKCRETWDQKRANYISDLPQDVAAVLTAAGVLKYEEEDDENV